MSPVPAFYRGQTPRTMLPGSGGEGPWYSDNFCGSIIIDGVEGDQYVLWAYPEPNVVGAATLSDLQGNTIYLVTATGGEFQVNQDACAGGKLLMHLLPVGSPIMSVCG